MLRTILAVASLAAFATVANADVISERKDIMDGVGNATRTGTQMVRGQVPFDLEQARVVLATYVKASESMPALFPAGTETGGKTSAAASIWTDRAGFEKGFQEWGVAVTGVAGSVQDLPTFTSAFGVATQSCRSCHEAYRVKTN